MPPAPAPAPARRAPVSCDLPNIPELEKAAKEARGTREVFEQVYKGGRKDVNQVSEESLREHKEDIQTLLSEELARNQFAGVTAIEEIRGELAKLDATDDDAKVLPQVERGGEGSMLKRIEQRARDQVESARARAQEEGLSPAIKQKRALELRTSEAFVNYLTQVGSLRTPMTTEAIRDTYMDAVEAELLANAPGIGRIINTPQGDALRTFVSERAEDVTQRILYLTNKHASVPAADRVWKRVVYSKLMARQEVRTNTYVELAKIVAQACKNPPPRPQSATTAVDAAYDAQVRNVRAWAVATKHKMRLARIQNMGYAHYGAGTDALAAPAARAPPAPSRDTPIVAAAAAAASARAKTPIRKRGGASSSSATGTAAPVGPVTPGGPVRKRPTPGAASGVTASVFNAILSSPSAAARRAQPPPEE